MILCASPGVGEGGVYEADEGATAVVEYGGAFVVEPPGLMALCQAVQRRER
jgi:hypothetical protein